MLMNSPVPVQRALCVVHLIARGAIAFRPLIMIDGFNKYVCGCIKCMHFNIYVYVSTTAAKFIITYARI